MTELSIDTKAKRIHVRVELAGETQPVEIEIERYNLKTKGDQAQLTIEAASASREWLNIALREFVIGRSFPVPPAASTLLKLLT